MSKTIGPIENLDDDPVIAENIRLRNALEKAEVERDALLAERAKDHAEINLKADFIDATINQLAEAEATRDAAIRAALDMAADIVDNHFDAWDDRIINGSSLDITRRSIRTITIADVLAKVGAK